MNELIDDEVARRAIELAMPTIELAMRDPAKGDSGCLHVVVMDPHADPASATFDAAILHEHSINRDRWDADYARFARAKAKLAWRHRCDSHALQSLRPWLVEPGDTLLWGSVWLDGIAVGVSGMQPWYDEAIAAIVASCIRAAGKARARDARSRSPFL